MNVIKIWTTVISMLSVITLLDLILVHVTMDTLAMGFLALVSMSHNHFGTEVYKKSFLYTIVKVKEWIISNLDQMQFLP